MKIELRNISFSYKKKSKKILDNVSLVLASNEITVLQGANGCGKTTLGKVILGLLRQNSGEVLIDNTVQKKNNTAQRANAIGYVFQNPAVQFFANTLKDEIYFSDQFRQNKVDPKRAEELMHEFELDQMSEVFPLKLSGGEKQKLALLVTVLNEPKFLILDEPSASIDATSKQFLIKFLTEFKHNGGGILLISHDEDFVSELNIDRVIELKGGKIYEE